MPRAPGSVAQDTGMRLIAALSDVLRAVRLKGGVSLHAEFTTRGYSVVCVIVIRVPDSNP
jgi:hypothetical protein